MHPPLHKPSNMTACEDVIKALEECHATMKKWWGGCNQNKVDVTLCLRAERVARTQNHRQEAKTKNAERKKKMEAIMQDLDRE
ncbi:Uncharacterized conserved protein [Phaffia rhodozyma]|uniref:COX assembly mitochondrial protein n=1 Tax=Phaffia rhodozyma TaxID=264483 RepID=A0A0F7SQN7_PHARH|nr:Uncharacterized conserved protein [Phaffia rhodozyma]